MYSLLNQETIQVDCDGNIANDQSITKPGSALSSQIISSMIPQQKCFEYNVYQMYTICDKVLTYDCFLDDSLPGPHFEWQFEDRRVTHCSISFQHFAHCPALNPCETKSVTTDTISILEDSFVTYIESSKAKSFLGKVPRQIESFIRNRSQWYV